MRIFIMIVVLSGLRFSPLMANEFDGVYWTTVIPDVAEGYFGVRCVGAKGHIQIIDGVVEGEVISEQLIAFDVTGTIDDNGLLQGGIGLSVVLLSSFEGHHQGDSGVGKWETANGCEGSWQAERVKPVAGKIQPALNVEEMKQRLCTNKAYLKCANQDEVICADSFFPALEYCQTLLPLSSDVPWVHAAALAFNQCIVIKHLYESGANMRDAAACLARGSSQVEQ